MSRTTIDFGIDLGTTNSAVAVLKGISTEIIKNNDDTDITPSAVSIDKKGVLAVGQRARNKVTNPLHRLDVHQEFKRQMGTDHLYVFKSSGQQRRPEELSAEVLKSLRQDAQRQMSGELMESAVITVPAAFELHQCDATRKAGQLAGFKHSPLLQEPVAAALAYGFQADQRKAYWLVYDFGGGTFDAAIIKAEEGSIHVVNHGGDNFLGGSDIDWAIVDKLLIPRLTSEYHLEDFSRSNKKWADVFPILKRSAELAKIYLSVSERVALEDCRFPGSDGEPVELECELTRRQIASVAEPFVLSSVEICKRVLQEKKLGKDAIERLILVGGPTKAPYFRELLSSALGITLDYSADPLTVVARGAAVFAGSQKIKVSSSVPIPLGEFQMELARTFNPVGIDSDPMVGGKFAGATPQSFAGFTFELINVTTRWRSGKIAVREDGVFTAHLHAEPGDRNTFAVELYDGTGRKQKVTPDALVYTIGANIDEQSLMKSMGIALANNEVALFLEKGRGLPVKATLDFKTIDALRQGDTGDVLRVPVIEGEMEKADRNRRVGELIITGTNIQRDLPAGSDVEITLRIDESRLLIVTAYFPILDEEFTARIGMGTSVLDAGFLKKDFDAEMRRFRDVRSQAAAADGATASELAQNVEDSELMREVNETLAAASGGNKDAAVKCEARLLQLKVKLDEAADALEWPMLVKEARDWITYLNRVVTQHGNEQQKQRAGTLTHEAESGVVEGKAERLRKKIAELSSMYWSLVLAQPGWWVAKFQEIEKGRSKFTNEERAARLLGQGRDCVAKNNFPGLQNIVRQLWDILPKEIADAARRGYEAGIVR